MFGSTVPNSIHIWYIYLHEWLFFMVNVGKYTSPMDAMFNVTWMSRDGSGWINGERINGV